MGYTHYWRELNSVDESDYQAALSDIRKLVETSPIPLFDGNGEGIPEVEGYISFNGDASKGEDHESFYLSATAAENGSFEFCKTARKPYDLVVVASLAVLADRVKGVIVSSDGDASDWTAGVKFASKTLGRIIKNPLASRRTA
jgi:hypothetical protein